MTSDLPDDQLRGRVKHVPVNRRRVFGNRDAIGQHLRGGGEMAQRVGADVNRAAGGDKTGQVLTQRSVAERADGTGQGFDPQPPGFADQEQSGPPPTVEHVPGKMQGMTGDAGAAASISQAPIESFFMI